jgi:hypothetical protein
MKRTAVALFVCATVAAISGQQRREPASPEQLLPQSVDGWEPALATAPNGDVYVVAGKRRGGPRDKDFDQRQEIWRSEDGGATFEGPWPLTTEGLTQADQRIAVDAKGTIYVSYMDWVADAKGGRSSRLRLARSQDRGRTFSVQTVTTHRVSDKPELAISSDGLHLYIVYESGPGPAVVASHDGGLTWTEPLVIAASEGRHFWPEALAVAPDGSIWLAVPSMSDSDIAKRKETTVTLHVFRSDDRGRTWRDFEMSRSPRLPGACPHNPSCPVKVPRITLAVDGRNRAHVVYTEGATPQQPYGLFHQSSADGGRTWSSRHVVSAAPRPQSADRADHDYVIVSASKDNRVCAVWVDDRRGALDVWARCSTDAGRSWGAETRLSDRDDGAPYKSADGFKAFYGHYGGAAIDAAGRLHAAWGAGEPGYRTGGVWVNRVAASGPARQ